MPTAPNNRTRVLLGIAALVALALMLDMSQGKRDGGDGAEEEVAPRDTIGLLRERIGTAQALLNEKDEVERAYRALAPSYVENAARLLTLSDGRQTPRQVVDSAIRNAAKNVTITNLLIGEPEKTGEGTYTLSASIQIKAGDSQAFLETFHALGNPDSGMVFKEFTVIANSEEKTLDLTGTLDVLVAEVAE